MGGKHKQAQRTKNNARPSSSGRSAELIASTPHFSGFSNFKDQKTFVLSGFTLPDEFDSTIDSNFQLVLKKMGKKDSTTKLKALQEFTELVKNTETEVIIAILPFWPRLYVALVTDVDHRVREATHIAHHEVVQKAKKNIAPYLKQLAGAWFTSQYDTYPPAAAAAKTSFEATFPANKLQEAVIFCQEEILNYIHDNLSIQSPEALNNSKMLSPEDCEAKFERVIISSLHGYSFYLEKIPIDIIEKENALNENIITNGKFWKLSKHKIALIRAAFFGVLVILIQKAPFLLKNQQNLLVSTVISNVDDSEPTVLPRVWEALLLVAINIDSWWKCVNIEKIFYPKLWKILSKGGQGNASVIYKNLLPLLPHLPVSEEKQFYPTFFEKMRTGLNQKIVLNSKSETSAIISSIMECFQFVIMKNQSNLIFCKHLINTHLIPMVDWCFVENQFGYKPIFNHISTLLQCWHKNSLNNTSDNYRKYLTYFWENIDQLFEILISNSNEKKNESNVASKQVEFCREMKQPSKVKKYQRVKFTSEEIQPSPSKTSFAAINLDCSYLKEVDSLVLKICERFVKRMNEKQNNFLLEHLYNLLNNFQSHDLITSLSEKVNSENKTSSSVMNIFENILSKWLNLESFKSKFLIDLTFLLFNFADENEQKLMLNEITKTNDMNYLVWGIAKALSHPFNEMPSIQDWLRSKKISDFLINIANQEINSEGSSEMSLILTQIFTEQHNGKLLIEKSTINGILEVINTCILNPVKYPQTIDTCASLAAYISTTLCTDEFALTFGTDLLLSLFSLDCKINEPTDDLSQDTLWEVQTAWHDGITTLSSTLSKDDFKTYTFKFSSLIKQFVLNSNTDCVNIPHFTDIIANYLLSSYKNQPMLIENVFDIFFNQNCLNKWENDIKKLCTCSEYLNGNLYSDRVLDVKMEINDTDIEKFFIWKNLEISVLTHSLNDSDSFKIYDALRDNPNYFVNQLYNICLADWFLTNFKNVKCFNEIKKRISDIKKLFNLFDINETTDIEKLIVKKIQETNNYIWTKVFYKLHVEILKNDTSYVFNDIFCKRESNFDCYKKHLIQVFSQHLSYDNFNFKLSSLESVIVLRHLAHCEEIDVQIAEVFSTIEKIKQEFANDTFCNINFKDWEKSQIILEIINLFISLINIKASSLTRAQWDLIVISFCSWTTTMFKTKSNYSNIQVSAFVNVLSNLYCAIMEYVQKLKEQNPSHNFICEWNNLFVDNVNINFICTWYYLSEEFNSLQIETARVLPLNFNNFLQYLDYKFIFKCTSNEIPKWTKFLKSSMSLLLNSNPSLQLWGYYMIKLLIPGLIEVDSVSVNTNTPHKKGLIFEQFKDLILKTQEIVKTMLCEFKLGENSCTVKPFTDSYTYTFAYFLIWDILLNLCERANTELNYQYSDWLRKEELLNCLLDNIFKLIPSEILLDGLSKKDIFEKPKLNLNGTFNSELLENLVGYTYLNVLLNLPASVRQWWTNTDSKVAQTVDIITSKYLTPYIRNQELSFLSNNEMKFKNMVVKVLSSINAVKATYTIDEAQMELLITLPNNYPLGGPDVQCNKEIGGTSHKQWLMQLKMCVLHQNGCIWDGLALWNKNLDKKFDGVEECYICFAVLHPGTYQLPKLSCHTCRKKFHSACLYKWFSTSNKSTCPICRNLF